MNNIHHPFNEFRGMAGKDWLNGFKRRNPEVTMRKAQNLNEARARKMNHFVVDDYFLKLQQVMTTENLMKRPERIYNLDEKGIRLCLHKSLKVMAGKGSHRVHSRGKEHGENITVVGCVNATGNTVPPMILFKGKILRPEWNDDLPPGSVIEMTPKGSTTHAAFIRWLDHFAKFKPIGKFFISKFRINTSCYPNAQFFLLLNQNRKMSSDFGQCKMPHRCGNCQKSRRFRCNTILSPQQHHT